MNSLSRISASTPSLSARMGLCAEGSVAGVSFDDDGRFPGALQGERLGWKF
jgi:hypothetical protein